MHLVRSRLQAAIAAILPLLITACGSSASTNVASVTSPTSTRCQASVTNSSTSFDSAGGSGTLNVAVARDCTWTAATQSSWIAITGGASGQGDGAVSYRVAANSDPVTRQGTVSVADVPVAVSQQGAPCRYDVSVGQESIPAAGGSIPIEVRTHAACAWTAVPEVSWADVNPRSGKGSATVNLIVPANPGADRMATATVAGSRVTLVQRAAGAPAPAPGPAPAPTPAPTPSPSPEPSPTPAPTPSPGPTPVSQTDLSGRIDSISGACPALTFTVKSQTIFTTSATDFRKTSCTDLRKGMDVKISGWLMSDGTVRADQVEKR